MSCLVLAILLIVPSSVVPCVQRSSLAAGQSVTLRELDSHIADLGSFDYETRMNAARMVRRAPAPAAVGALADAVRMHEDEFVRYRALVLLTAFNDRGTRTLMNGLLTDRNDRVREVVFRWLERHPDPSKIPTLLAALQTETAEFVRPALVAALAAVGQDVQVQRALLGEVGRGFDFFRSAVIDALGRHRAAYAVESIVAVARGEGPLQDDAVVALGRIGDARARPVLTAVTKTSTELRASVTAAQCLLGEGCDRHLAELMTMATMPGASWSVVRAAVNALSVLAVEGDLRALSVLYGLGRQDSAMREVVGVGIGVVALRRPDLMLEWLERTQEETIVPAVDLLKEGFNRLEEDFAKEQFFAVVRATYWKTGDGSATRRLAAMLIQRLEF